VSELPIHSEGVQVFESVTIEMASLLGKLLAAPAARVSEHETIPKAPGIYLFSTGDEAVYVGQTRNLRKRLRDHTNPLARENQASFAFLVAKIEAEKAQIDIERTRKILEADEAFAKHFLEAKGRVSEMEVRFIGLAGPIERTLFEIYAALALDTLVFNSFETH
jgi:predicted GIY-YIG superfamily endonuclease